ncbi:hypothetical protein TRFO_38647 [Tritrichomonas foetus]|uniref:Uncharacterized protein n=1 Tax=Tritrichomonas foetus TaxID=1144522 RepID=A0A1J4J7L2_9EUKA|nr:hypothetical protein TRFO_38647 [Tritrichomonas foetus]|eukprot:OHS95128.1 hypothetical protein TRFO_38647 [Tritrichomonas foetus]
MHTINCSLKKAVNVKRARPMKSHAQVRADDRTKLINDYTSYSDEEVTMLAQKLTTLSPNSDEYMDEISNFSSILKNSTSSQINILKSIHFDEYLLSIIKMNPQPFILQRCMSCVFVWINKSHNKDVIFNTPEFALICSSIILSPTQTDQRTCMLALAVLKTICSYSTVNIHALTENQIIPQIVLFYLNCQEVLIRRELLCLLYFIVKSKQIAFEIISECGKIFTEVVSNPYDPNLDTILALASAFASCGDTFCLIICDCLPLSNLFSSFENLSNDEQAGFLRLLISVFDSSNEVGINILVDIFNWEIVPIILSRPNNEILKEYFIGILCSSFPKSIQMIIQALKNNIFSLLLEWITGDQFKIQSHSLIAVLRSIRFGMPIVGEILLNNNILNIIILFLDSNSKILIREICETSQTLAAYFAATGKLKITEVLERACIPMLLEEIENSDDEPLSEDLIEMIKDSLQEIQDDQLWKSI